MPDFTSEVGRPESQAGTFEPGGVGGVQQIAFSGTSAIVVGVTGTLSVATAVVYFSGTSAIAFTTSGTLRLREVPLSGTSALSFAVSGTLTVSNNQVALSGTSAITFSVSCTLSLALVPFTGTAAIRFAVNGVPAVQVPFVGGPTGLIVLVRRPWLGVTIGGVEQTAITSAACHFGFDQRYATAEVMLRSVTGGVDLTYWLPIEISMGASALTAVPRFAGYILPIDNTSWVPGGVLHCRGPLGVAATFGNWDQTEQVAESAYGTDFTEFILTGTLAKTAGSPLIVGTGTAFTTELRVGMLVSVPGPINPTSPISAITGLPTQPYFESGRVLSIADDTHMILDTDMTHTYSGTEFRGGRYRTDGDIAAAVLAYYGLGSHYVFTLPTGGGFGDTIGGTGRFLGTTSDPNKDFEPLLWKRGQTGLDFLDALDQQCVGVDLTQPVGKKYGLYKTFETVGGFGTPNIFRTLVTANPQLAAGAADFAFAEGVDLLRDLSVTHDPTQVVNAVRVVGYDDGTGPNAYPEDPTIYLSANSPYLPSWMPNGPDGYPMVGRDFQFPLGERGESSEAGDGFACEDKARQLLEELTTEVVTVRASTYREDLFGPAQTHYLHAPIRAGVFQTVWCNRLDVMMSAQRVFRQQLEWIVKN